MTGQIKHPTPNPKWDWMLHFYRSGCFCIAMTLPLLVLKHTESCMGGTHRKGEAGWWWYVINNNLLLLVGLPCDIHYMLSALLCSVVKLLISSYVKSPTISSNLTVPTWQNTTRLTSVKN